MSELWEKIKQEGIAEGKKDTAKKMLEKNMSEELIIEITGLDRESINNLKLELA